MKPWGTHIETIAVSTGKEDNVDLWYPQQLFFTNDIVVSLNKFT
jgi:hypothetical protein